MRIVAVLRALHGGHPALAFAKALSAMRGDREVMVVLEDGAPDVVLPLRATLEACLPRGAVRTVSVAPLAAHGPVRAALVDAVFGAVIADLMPDVLVMAAAPGGGADQGPQLSVTQVLAVLHAAPPRLEILQVPRVLIGKTAPVVMTLAESDGGVRDAAEAVRLAVRALFDAAAGSDEPRPDPGMPTDPAQRPRLALVSARAAASDAGCILDPAFLRALSRWYAVDVVTDTVGIAAAAGAAGCPVVPLQAFRKALARHDRVLYDLGNSPEDAAIPDLLETVPGVAVLRDFALSRTLVQTGRDALARALRDSHGYGAVRPCGEAGCMSGATSGWPANLPVLQAADGVIVHDAAIAQLADSWYGSGASHGWAILPPVRPLSAVCAAAAWADGHAAAIETFQRRRDATVKAILDCARVGSGVIELSALAETLAIELPPQPRLHQLLVDVSALVRADLNTGIQRVVRSILRVWLDHPPAGWAVEPVYGYSGQAGYVYARRWTAAFLGLAADWHDEPVDVWAGDVFLGLDLAGDVVICNEALLAAWARRGVAVHFVVYDLLPVLMPHHFEPKVVARYRGWLDVVLQHAGAICISRSVAAELSAEAARSEKGRGTPLRIRTFGLGTGIGGTGSGTEFPEGGAALLRAMRQRTTFLMVGTVEPRKGHGLALAAFERLWARGADIGLVIAGRQGWQVAALSSALRRHPEAGRRLHWIEDASDAFLERLYGAAACLLAASEGEGYGLPLLEAARYGLPVLARDIPVFREVTRGHALFFSATSSEALADAVMKWLHLKAVDRHPRSAGVHAMSWADSAASLLEAVGIAQDTGNALYHAER